MPELPEVQTVVSGLASTIVGKKIATCYSSGQTFRGRKMVIESEQIVGSTVTGCLRRAKYILIALSNGYTLLVHLGMSGKILVDNQALKHDHLILTFTDGSTLRFNDPRRFGVAKLTESSCLGQEPLLKNLGVEPLEAEFNVEALSAICRARRAPIKSVLLNANLVVGIGNIYASEALFESGILPTREANSLKDVELKRLYSSIVSVLKAAINSGGSTLRDYVRVGGDAGYFQHQFKVYGKQGKPCSVCDSPIQKIVISNRSTFFCNACQI